MYVDIRDKCVAKLAILSSLEKTISKDELHCYVRTLSPVKKAASSGRQYFHCTLQTETKAVRVVCFSQEKHGKFQSSEKGKSLLKLESCKPPQSEGEDLIVTRFTKVTPLVRDEIAFEYSDELTQKTKIIGISSLGKIAKEQLVTVKAEVGQISGVKSLLKQ